MDWAQDATGISDNDYRNVYRYEETHTTVVQMTTGEKEPLILSLKSEEDWVSWFQSEQRPRICGPKPGYVLLLAKRTGERPFCAPSRVGSGEWLDTYKKEIASISRTQRTSTFASLAEKSPTDGSSPKNLLGSGRRGVRTLPFSEKVFRMITKNFHTHGSISRVISRADVQTFSCSEVEMGESDGPTYMADVYNCRTSNAWDMDLALTATCFPHCGLTFAILFGCPLSVEEEIIKRLSFATAEAAHPLLLPGIFVELERTRHVHVVEAMIDELETKIFELDFHTGETEWAQSSSAERRNQEKRTAYLDTAYLRNGLINWSAQLLKMVQHAEYLENNVFASGDFPETTGAKFNSQPFELPMVSISHQNGDESSDCSVAMQKYSSHPTNKQMRRVGGRIKDRLQAIIDEYEDKIRDCTMRVDGMAMATQWAQGETNVEIALATGRDSRHMRSIALLTMVFLPGTFFASVFSMTFFNWSNSDGSAEVSGYIWIYILVTVCFTLLTVGTWYYFVIWRQSRPSKPKSEEEALV
ncbi:hypothetical protein LHYA1_G007945 [Lachnellula hyalina]|uniref:Uncharacterized protein n=1 Tax=Lachnellula hyalina TaxID=1316788 RepID=A0A8H8QV14_9HELO|nr:uncharacterized protein LHYA1_G007945 [Lachnellula hyalina]TVY23264.1 hypothetical protein LHYA1_G007945 [Lachnellula hyalina]